MYERYDPDSDIEEGVFYDNRDNTVFTVKHYPEDDGESHDGSMAFIVGEFDLSDPTGERMNDAELTGCDSLTDLLQGEWTIGCYVISGRGVEPATLSELHRDLLEYDGIDLSMAVSIMEKDRRR